MILSSKMIYQGFFFSIDSVSYWVHTRIHPFPDKVVHLLIPFLYISINCESRSIKEEQHREWRGQFSLDVFFKKKSSLNGYSDPIARLSISNWMVMFNKWYVTCTLFYYQHHAVVYFNQSKFVRFVISGRYYYKMFNMCLKKLKNKEVKNKLWLENHNQETPKKA